MGNCASSKFLLEGDEKIPAGLKPLQRKLEDAKKRRQKRHSIVSTTELLSQETLNSSDSSSGKANPSAIAPEPIPEEEEFKNDAKLREEFPGSPSFRFYCTDNLPLNRSFDSNDSIKLPAHLQRAEPIKETDEKIQNGKPTDEKNQDGKPTNEKIQDGKVMVKSQVSNDATVKSQVSNDAAIKPQVKNEVSEGKSTKKEKGRKLLTLPKAPSAVQNLFTCYTSTHSAASKQHQK